MVTVDLESFTEDLRREVCCNPIRFAAYWSEFGASIAARLPPPFGRLESSALAFVVATGFAHALKPYGPGPSGSDLADLLAASALDCSHYGLLSVELASIAVPRCREWSTHFVGWDGGAGGNHQFVFVSSPDDGVTLMLDPTLGLCALSDYNAIAAGRPLPPDRILSVQGSPELAAIRRAMAGHLTAGSFRPSDLLYYFESKDHFLLRMGSIYDWPTPGAAGWRRRQRMAGRYPTA